MIPPPPTLLRLLLLLPAGMAWAAEGADETVTIRDFTLAPLSSLGFAERSIEWHPKAMVGGGYDSNLYLDAPGNGKEGGWYTRGVAGLDLRWLPNTTDRMVLDGEAERSVYRRNPQRDFTGIDTNLHGNHEGPLFAVAGEAGFQRTQDPLVETRQIVPRDLWNLLAQGDYKGLIDTWTVGLRQDGVRYHEGFSGYSADQASLQTTGIFLRYGYQIAEEDELYTRLDGDRTAYRDGSAFNDSFGLRGVAGVRRGLATRTDALLEAGLSWRRYADVFHAPDPVDPTVILHGDSRQVWGPSGKAELHYSWEELSDVTVRAFSEITDSLTANAAWYGGITGNLRQRLLTNCAALAGIQAYRFRDLKPIGGLDAESRTTLGSNLGLEFFLSNGVGMRVMGAYEDSHARLSESYDRFTMFTDLAVVF